MNTRINIEKKILNAVELRSQANIWRLQEKKIVFTNGCFDLLHLGHIDYLAKAADLGDKLVIGLNSDRSTRQLKGPHRPINDEYSRAILLAALGFTDAIVLFDEETPLRLIQTLMPDVLVKGGDYSIEEIVGAKEVIAAGGQVQTLDFLPGYSTTLIEKKIREM